MSQSINDPHLIIVSRDPPMAWPLLNSCGSLFFSWIIFVHKKIISLSAEACPGNTSWIFILCKLREIQYTVVPRREREGENGRYQNHFLDIKIQRKRKKRNNCRFRKPCVSLNTNTQRISTHQNPNKRFWTPRYLLTQGIST